MVVIEYKLKSGVKDQEDGAFEINKSRVTLGDIRCIIKNYYEIANFPLKGCYHFRAKAGGDSDYVWVDLFQPTQTVDPVGDLVSLKVIEIEREFEEDYKKRSKNPIVGKTEVAKSSGGGIGSLFKGGFFKKK